MASFLKKKSEDSRKSNGNGENKNENSSDNNNSSIKDTSLFVNDDNEDKDLNFKNLISILNKKFKSYLSKDKFNKSEIVNKNKKQEHKKSNDYNKNITLNMNKISFINDIKNEGNKNNLFKSFNFQKTSNIDTEINNKNDDNSYILLSYSKKDKVNQINKTNIKYNKSIKGKNKIIQTELKQSSNTNPSKIINFNSHHNTFLDISTNYEPNMDSRNSSVERSISVKKKDLRNFSCSPSHENKKAKNVNNIKKGKINITKKNNKNFNTIIEDEEWKNGYKNKNPTSKEKKRKKMHICQNKVTINLTVNDDNNININSEKNSKKGYSKLKKIVIKKGE